MKTNKIKLFIATLFMALPVLSSIPVYAQFNPLEPSCDQISNSANSEICAPASSNENPITGSRSIFLVVADILTIAAGIIAVVIVIISGISMITSSGDPAKIKKNRDTIIYTFVGIVVVLLSRSIVIFIVGQLA